MIFTLLALQILDIVTTVLALRVPGTREVNPILNKLFDRFGVLPTLIAVKLSYSGLALGLLYSTPPSTLIDAVVLLVCAVYVYVVYNNAKIYWNRAK